MDLIDRQAAIDKVDRIVDVNHLNPDMVWFTPNGVKTLMEELPSAQSERKKGKWKIEYLTHEAMGGHPRIIYCSECSQCVAYPVNFCPSCGAKMGAE